MRKSSTRDPALHTSGRESPQNLDAERNVLGAMLIHPDVVGDVALLLRPEDFLLRRHQVIFAAILTTHAEK